MATQPCKQTVLAKLQTCCTCRLACKHTQTHSLPTCRFPQHTGVVRSLHPNPLIFHWGEDPKYLKYTDVYIASRLEIGYLPKIVASAIDYMITSFHRPYQTPCFFFRNTIGSTGILYTSCHSQRNMSNHEHKLRHHLWSHLWPA